MGNERSSVCRRLAKALQALSFIRKGTCEPLIASQSEVPRRRNGKPSEDLRVSLRKMYKRGDAESTVGRPSNHELPNRAVLSTLSAASTLVKKNSASNDDALSGTAARYAGRDFHISMT